MLIEEKKKNFNAKCLKIFRAGLAWNLMSSAESCPQGF